MAHNDEDDLQEILKMIQEAENKEKEGFSKKEEEHKHEYEKQEGEGYDEDEEDRLLLERCLAESLREEKGRHQSKGISAPSSSSSSSVDFSEMYAPLPSPSSPPLSSSSICQICSNPLPVDSLYILDECSHRFCQKCLEKSLSSFTLSLLQPHHPPLSPSSSSLAPPFAALYAVPCPIASCGSPVSLRDLELLLTPSLFVNYQLRAFDLLFTYLSQPFLCPSCGLVRTGANPLSSPLPSPLTSSFFHSLFRERCGGCERESCLLCHTSPFHGPHNYCSSSSSMYLFLILFSLF